MGAAEGGSESLMCSGITRREETLPRQQTATPDARGGDMAIEQARLRRGADVTAVATSWVQLMKTTRVEWMATAEGTDSQDARDVDGRQRAPVPPPAVSRKVERWKLREAAGTEVVIACDLQAASEVGGSSADGVTATSGGRVRSQADSDIGQGEVRSERSMQKASMEVFTPGCDRGQQQAAVERAEHCEPRRYFDVYQQYFDAVEGALMAGKQGCAASNGTGQMLDVLHSCFDWVIRAGCDMANGMAERVADLEAERDMLRASRRVVETGVETEMPEWLSVAEGLLQVKTAVEATPGEASKAAAEETSEEAREAAAECDRRGQAAVKLQRVWRLHSESVAQDRVRGFFAKAVAEEAWRRALTEFEQSMAMAAVQEAAEAAALAEEDARAQRKAEAKARLEVREAEERHKRKAREAEFAARKAAVQAARALPLPSPPSTPPRLPPSQPIDRPSPRRLFPSPSPPVTPPRPPPPQTADLSSPTPPRTADSPSPRSFLPSWRRAHMAACLLQRAWCNRVRREEAAAEARARECASDGEVASRLTVLEAEKAAMENRLANSVATARAFRRLEAELREQGIRLASGVGTGGRQRKRRHERRRAERMATSLSQRQLSMW